MQNILELKNIGYSYHSLHGETRALENISFGVGEGEFVAIVGPSGCGKSTLLSIIAGLLAPEQGTILVNNPDGSLNYPKVGYMLQRDHLFEWRSIYRNVTLGLELHNLLTPERLRTVDRLLMEYGLDRFRDKRPSELSGGMKQRAALIRTLALEPDLLLLDEPFSALDYQTRLSVCDDIAAIIKKEEKTAILVTHDLSEAISMADQVLVLSKRPGRVQRLVPVAFAMEERTPMRSRNAPEFKDYFNLIWKELNISG